MSRIKKIAIPGILAGSLVGSFLALSSAGPASAGAGTSQTVVSSLRLPVAVPAQYITRCTGSDPDNQTCTTYAQTTPINMQTMDIVLAYSYTAGRVDTAPDVTTTTGQLPKLGNSTACAEKYGVRIQLTGASFTGSRTQGNVNGQSVDTGGTSTAKAPGAAGDGYFEQWCVDNAPSSPFPGP